MLSCYAKIIGGKQLNNNFALGVGSGFNYMGVTGDSDGHISYIPLFADIRINFTANETTPYLFVDPGYSFVTGASGEGDYSGGFYLNEGLGVRTKLNDNSDFDFSVSYMLQKTKIEANEYYYYGNGQYMNYSYEADFDASYTSIMRGFYFM